ncbi:MAG: protein kinase [Acidobacteriota bacterium]|nr:protein kinase [Acidobacteriota bacterium]
MRTTIIRFTMPLAAGTRVGPYEIVGAIGAGGMGEVYRARDTRLGRDVAVKVLPASFASDPERLRRFEQEARAVAALNHPNILAVYDIGAHGGAPFLVTELLEGETLRERLGEGALPVRKAIDIAVQAAHGVAAAHEKGIIHRDLKPANIFLTSDGRVKILDFGLAKLTERESKAPGETQDVTLTAGGATEPGVVLGTVGYMSPEQVRGKPADARSDIFALGTILYEMLSGRRAFEKDSSVDTMAAILKEEPPELAGEGKIPPGVDRIVRHCLEKHPAERFQSARDLAFHLEPLSSSSATSAPALAAARSPRSKWLLSAAVAALAIAVAAFFAGRHFAGPAATHPPTFLPVSFEPGAVFNARFAPDGKTVVFSAANEGNSPQLFLRQPDYPAPQPFGPPDTALLAISSQGQIAVLTGARFVANRIFTGTLATMNLGGGAPREILQNVQDADWSPDGSQLAVIRSENGEGRLEFPIGKVLYRTAGYLSDLRFSPSGNLIAFFDHPFRYDDRGRLVVVDFAGHTRSSSGNFQSLEGIAWAKNGEGLYFSSCCVAGANTAIEFTSLPGKTQELVTAAGNLFVLDANSEGNLLATENTFEYRVMAKAPGATAERGLSWLDSSYHPHISADGEWLLFSDTSEAAGHNYALLYRKTDGSPAVRLGEGIAMGLSPDGSWALSIVPGPPAQLALYPTGAGEKRVLDPGGIVDYQSARFFPDGKRVLACGHKTGQALRCYVQATSGGAPLPITPPGTDDGFVSPDSKTVLVRGRAEGYRIFPVAGGPGHAVAGLEPDDEVIRFSADGRSVLVFSASQVPAEIERVDLSTGRRVPVLRLATANRTGVVQVIDVSLASHAEAYAYAYALNLSQLSLIRGAQRR